jgi:DNase/tRNase domain of colicin-like bacteriocin
MSVKINPILTKHQPSKNYSQVTKPKIADKPKQKDQAIKYLAVRFNGNDETKPPKKTVTNLYHENLQKDPIDKNVGRKYNITLGLELKKSTNKTTVEDYTKAFDRALFNKAGYTMLTDSEVKTAAAEIKGKDWKQTNWSLNNLRAIDNKPGQMYANTNQYTIEQAKRAGAAVLQFNKNEAETFDRNQAHGNRYMPEAIGGFAQPIVNAPVNIINGLSEPFRAGEKMLFGTNNIPIIPRMEVAERSEYWNKDNRMLANKGAEFGASIIFGGGAGTKALATKGGRALLGLEASYNFAAGTFGKDVTQTDANGNPRQMGYVERGGRVFGGVFGARQVVKAEVNTPSSLVNKLDDIFKPKPPQPEAITPEGFRVKVTQTEDVKGSNVFESRANGFPNQRIPSNNGSWNGKVGESGWLSNKPEVIAVTKGNPVPYKNGFPVFDKWINKVNGVKGEIKLLNMKGNHDTDFKNADKLFAKKIGWFKKDGVTPDGKRVEQLRDTQNLTWHHHEDMTTMQLVPADLNNKVPHTGGASFVKRGNK